MIKNTILIDGAANGVSKLYYKDLFSSLEVDKYTMQ